MRGTATNIIVVTQPAPVSFLIDQSALSRVTSQCVTLLDTQQTESIEVPWARGSVRTRPAA